MFTEADREALLAIACAHCGAAPGERCSVPGARPSGEGRRAARRAITTLEGGCHDRRWRDAVGRPAAVLAAEVARLRGVDVPERVQEDTGPVLVGAGLPAPGEAPW